MKTTIKVAFYPKTNTFSNDLDYAGGIKLTVVYEKDKKGINIKSIESFTNAEASIKHCNFFNKKTMNLIQNISAKAAVRYAIEDSLKCHLPD